MINFKLKDIKFYKHLHGGRLPRKKKKLLKQKTLESYGVPHARGGKIIFNTTYEKTENKLNELL